jgi:hypothetical protein
MTRCSNAPHTRGADQAVAPGNLRRVA